MTNLLRVWARSELEALEEGDRPEGHETLMLRVAVSPKLLLLLMDYQSDREGEDVEVVSAHGDPMAVELRFFKRDRVDPDMVGRHAAFPYPECVARKGGCPDHPWVS